MSSNPPNRRWSTPTLCLCAVLAAAPAFFLTRASSAKPPSPSASTRARSAQTAPPSTAADWDRTWQSLQKQTACPARTRELSRLLEQLARTDPRRAIALAEKESNWLVRDDLRDAALRGWGATAPDAAADWAMQHRLDQRMRYVSAVLAGAAENPTDAVRVALRVCQADPEPAADYGHALVNALVEKTGSFADATRFVAAVGTDRQQHLLDSAYYQWARYQPDAALAAINQIQDPKIRSSAYDGLLAGWANADATKLASFAMTLPPGDERTRAFDIALPRWVERDPAAATEWIGNMDPSPDLNAGIAKVATLPSLVAQNPRLSFDWADNITDQAQRIMTKHEIFTQWAQKDRKAATEFANNTRNPDERDMMIAALEGM